MDSTLPGFPIASNYSRTNYVDLVDHRDMWCYSTATHPIIFANSATFGLTFTGRLV